MLNKFVAAICVTLLCNAGLIYAQAPVITLKPNIVLALDATGNYNVTLADVATVTNTQHNSVITVSPQSFDCSSLGSQTVTVTATNIIANPQNVNFIYPTGIAIDAAGNLYVTELGFYGDVRQITPAGVVTTYVAGTQANTLSAIEAVGLSPDGNMYLTSFGLNVIDKITPAKAISIFDGIPYSSANDGQDGRNVSFNGPIGMAIDKGGNIYVTDLGASTVRKITPDGFTTTVAGKGMAGFADAKGKAAAFNRPFGLAIDAAGNLYVGDTDNNRVRKIAPDGTVTTIAGSGASGATNGIGTAAAFNNPTALTVDAAGNIYVCDTGNQEIRKIAVDGTVTTIAGNGNVGAIDGPRLQASFNGPNGIAIDAEGNLFVTDTHNNKIRKITQQGVVSTFAGSGIAGDTNGNADFSNQATASIPVTVQSATGATGIGVPNSVNIITSAPNNVILPGEAVTFTAHAAFTAGVSYQWQINGQNTGSDDSVFTARHLFTNDKVTCTITTSAGCAAPSQVISNSITIVVSSADVIINNTFTPNGDGVNDIWQIPLLAAYPACKVNIYNRYGALIYNSTGYSKAWDGTYKGKALPNGTYYYTINLMDGRPSYTGAVTMIR